MIFRESSDAYTFITQHDQATISGEFFMNLKKDFVPNDYYESLKFAIYQHKRGWLVPDIEPIWNDVNKQPHDFLSYPSNLKYHFYKIGIEQTDQVNSYATLLCSMYYTRISQYDTNENAKAFVAKEIQRQKHLIQKLNIQNDSYLQYQLKVMAFCDDLSNYICLNKPGVVKKEEYALYQSGFPNSAFFNDQSDKDIIAKYTSRNQIKLNCSPFLNKFELKIPIKRVLKEDVEKHGLAYSFHKEPISYQSIKIS